MSLCFVLYIYSKNYLQEIIRNISEQKILGPHGPVFFVRRVGAATSSERLI